MNLPVYPHASPLPKNKDLPVTTTTCVHAHICTRSWPYLFIFILSFRLTVKIYPSTFALFYMSTDAPVHQYTCSVYFLFFHITCAMTFQLICWGTYTQIHPKVNVPVYLHASLSSNHKGLPVTTTTCVHAHRCTRSWPYVFIFRLSFRLTVKIYPFTVLHVPRCICSSVHLFGLLLLFRRNLHNDLSTHLLGYLHNRSTRKYIYPFTFMLFFRLTTATCVHAHRCTRSWPYLFILSFRLTV